MCGMLEVGYVVCEVVFVGRWLVVLVGCVMCGCGVVFEVGMFVCVVVCCGLCKKNVMEFRFCGVFYCVVFDVWYMWVWIYFVFMFVVVMVVMLMIWCMVVVGVRMWIGLVVLSRNGLIVMFLLLIIFSRLYVIFVVLMFGMISRFVLFDSVVFGNVCLWISFDSVVLLCILLLILRFGVCLIISLWVLDIWCDDVDGVLLKFEFDSSVVFGVMLKCLILVVVWIVMLVSWLVFGSLFMYVLYMNRLWFGSISRFIVVKCLVFFVWFSICLMNFRWLWNVLIIL